VCSSVSGFLCCFILVHLVIDPIGVHCSVISSTSYFDPFDILLCSFFSIFKFGHHKQEIMSYDSLIVDMQSLNITPSVSKYLSFLLFWIHSLTYVCGHNIYLGA
jgi:hypothetical protein